MDDLMTGVIVFGSGTLLALGIAGIASLLGFHQVVQGAGLAAGFAGFWTGVLAIPYAAMEYRSR